MNDNKEPILNAPPPLASKPDAGPAPDRPAVAMIEDRLSCRIEGGDGWAVVTDMPAAVGGGAAAPSPAWLVRAAPGSCTAMAIAMRAPQREVEFTRLEGTPRNEEGHPR